MKKNFFYKKTGCFRAYNYKIKWIFFILDALSFNLLCL
jgi:hypothetical protein